MNTTIIIPVYNSGAMIGECIRALTDVLDAIKVDYEILLRDDGSTDESRAVIRQVSEDYPEVRDFYNQANKGLGYTLRALLRDARGRNIVYCDCDLPFGADVIPRLLTALDQVDVAVASRYSGAVNKTPLNRKIFSRLYFYLCRVLFNVPVLDIGSGTVAMRRAACDRMKLNADGFDIHAEFYQQALRSGLRIREIPVSVCATRRGSFCVWLHGPDTVLKTFKLFFRTRAVWQG